MLWTFLSTHAQLAALVGMLLLFSIDLAAWWLSTGRSEENHSRLP